MNRSLSFCIFTVLFCLFAEARILRADEGTIRLEIFSVDKNGAGWLLNDQRFVTDPPAVLKRIHEMKDRNEAALVAVPTLRGAYPFRTKVTGNVIVEVDAGLIADKSECHLNISVDAGKPGDASSLVTALSVKRGKPKFLGCLEPSAIDHDKTWLVFIYVD